MTKMNEYTCPTCHKTIQYTQENPHRPFCSDRCKLIDLGEWADESRKIPGATINPDNLNASEDKDN